MTDKKTTKYPQRFQDIAGMQFGKWTVLELRKKRHSKHAVWLCRCSCGRKRFVVGTYLRSGKSKSCGQCRYPEIDKRIEAKTIKTSRCWLWVGKKLPTGYGILTYQGKRHYAHRLVHELSTGQAPGRLMVCHRCDNPSCVRPDHLFLGTAADNVNDMMAKGRNRNRPMFGKDNPAAKLTPGQVRKIRDRYATGLVRQVDLAREYGVRQTSISNVVLGTTWK